MIKQAEAAYAAYYEKVDGQHPITKETLPLWEDLKQEHIDIWVAIADGAVQSAMRHNKG